MNSRTGETTNRATLATMARRAMIDRGLSRRQRANGVLKVAIKRQAMKSEVQS